MYRHPHITDNSLYKTTSSVSLLYWFDKLCLPGCLNTECTEASPLSVTRSSVSQKTWVMVQQSPCVSDKCPLQEHLPSKAIIDSISSVSTETLAVNTKSLPQDHWEPAFSWPSFEYNDPINSLSLSPADPNNLCAGFLRNSSMFQIMPLLTLQHKYGCHIANISQTTIILNGHKDPTHLPTFTKIQPTTILTSHIIAKYMLEKNALKCHIYAIFANYIMYTWDNYATIYTSYELSAINIVTTNTGIHSIHIIDICPWTNIPTTSHMYIPLHL